MKKSFLVVLAAVALPTAASAAVPQAEVEVVSVDVAYSDLALDKNAGAETLTRRVNAAVQAVCARPDMRNLKAMRNWQECREAAVNSAKAQVTPVLAMGRVTVENRY